MNATEKKSLTEIIIDAMAEPMRLAVLDKISNLKALEMSAANLVAKGINIEQATTLIRLAIGSL